MTYTIPESLQAYFSDDRAVARAVDALVPDLAGKKCPEFEFDHIRNYNQALLMAAKVRADFIDVLFELWNGTFGAASAAALFGEENLDPVSSESTPYAIWENSQINRHYFGTQERGAACMTVTMDRWSRKVSLELWSDDDDFDVSSLSADDWDAKTWDGNVYLRSTEVAISDLIADPHSTIEKLRGHAEAIVQALKNNEA